MKVFQKIHARTLSTAEAYSLLFHVYLQQTYLIMKYLPLDKSGKTDEMLKETGETLTFLFLMNEVKPDLPQKAQIQSKIILWPNTMEHLTNIIHYGHLYLLHQN